MIIQQILLELLCAKHLSGQNSGEQNKISAFTMNNTLVSKKHYEEKSG